MSAQRLVDVSGLEAALQKFAAERGWDKFHSPKNLAMALTGEVGELVEVFQWLTEDESRTVAQDSRTSQSVRDELADVLLYVVRLASVLQVDLNEAVITKLDVNVRKYPVGTEAPDEWGTRV
jgi:NTP pyrophosphatase (non-canonical NTP hydrolase)